MPKSGLEGPGLVVGILEDDSRVERREEVALMVAYLYCEDSPPEVVDVG